MELFESFKTVKDPRKNINKKHDFIDILFLTISAVISGALGWKDIKEFGDEKLEWLRQYREFKNGIPVDDTIARVIRLIKPDEFNQCFIDWVNTVRKENNQPQIAIDGKTLRHSFEDKPADALHSITAWNSTLGLVVAQMKSAGKKNENESVLKMLDVLNIKGAHITVDAMNTQKKIAEKIIKNNADYTMCVKNNHKKLKEEIAAYFHKVRRENPEMIASNQTVEKGHGRIETRICHQLRVSEWVSESSEWAGIQSVIEITRERFNLKTQKTESETLYYISSRYVDIKETAEAIRNHWGVENKAHWVLDVSFKEDDSRIRSHDGAENVAIIRRFCLNLCKLHPGKNSMVGKIKCCGWSDKFRTEVIFG